MGWSGLSDSSRMPKHLRTVVEKACFLDGTDMSRVVASNSIGTMRKGEVYLALRLKDESVIGVVILCEDGMVKSMSDAMGPYYYGASAKVLDALSPTTDECALRWRAACRGTEARPNT